MTREKTAGPRLALVGALCGLGAAAVDLLLVRLLVFGQLTGLPHLAGLSLAVPGGPRSALVWDLGGLTWFGLPSAVLYLVAPLSLLTAGLVAGRLTYSARAKTGLLAGLPVVLGFAPPMLLAGLSIGAGTVSLLAVPVAFPLVFGPLGAVVGVRT